MYSDQNTKISGILCIFENLILIKVEIKKEIRKYFAAHENENLTCKCL